MRFKEWLRKKLVTLKRNAHYIPLLMLSVSCIVFNLKLTSYSDSIAQINEPGMGLCSFAIVLCSFLSIITYLSAYPKRKKPKLGSLILVYLMLIISIACQMLFYYFIIYGTELKANPIEITEAKNYILTAKSMCIIHSILLIITIALMSFLPCYRKALQKIDTSIKVEDNEI